MTNFKKVSLAALVLTFSVAHAADDVPVLTPEGAPAAVKNTPAPASLPGTSGMLMGLSLSLEVPHPANLAFEIRPWENFSASASIGGLPTVSVPNNGTQISGSMFSPNAHFRWHPWGGAFFMGGILGYQSVNGSTTQNVTLTSPSVTVPTRADVNMSSMYLTPHLGWAWGMKSSGMFGGLELGAQVPMSPASKLGVTITDPQYAGLESQVQATQQYQNAVNDVQTQLNTIGRLALPYFAMRLGYMF